MVKAFPTNSLIVIKYLLQTLESIFMENIIDRSFHNHYQHSKMAFNDRINIRKHKMQKSKNSCEKL